MKKQHLIMKTSGLTLLVIAIVLTGLFLPMPALNNHAPTTAMAKAKAKVIPALRVGGNHLVNPNGKTVRLCGVSTHGLAWFPQYVNKAAFQQLRDEWGVNVIRLALYTEEYNGYLSGGDQKAQRKLINKGVKYATSLGMYVIIDWHILNDNNPNTHIEEAKKFFNKMSGKYADHTNVLYEICNEPHGVSWKNDIKPYALAITKVIRKHDKDAIIIVGTNTWSQDVDDVISDRLPDPNTVYTLHFYAATHQDQNRDKAKRALDAGVPVFISESSICDASGNGSYDMASAEKWFELVRQYHMGFIAWSLCNKAESSALLNSSCQAVNGWKDSDYTQAGKWYRSKFQEVLKHEGKH